MSRRTGVKSIYPARTDSERAIDDLLADVGLLDEIAAIEREQAARDLRRSLRRWYWRLWRDRALLLAGLLMAGYVAWRAVDLLGR